MRAPRGWSRNLDGERKSSIAAKPLTGLPEDQETQTGPGRLAGQGRREGPLCRADELGFASQDRTASLILVEAYRLFLTESLGHFFPNKWLLDGGGPKN